MGRHESRQALESHGQGVWLGFLARGVIAKGELKRLIETTGVAKRHLQPGEFREGDSRSDKFRAADLPQLAA